MFVRAWSKFTNGKHDHAFQRGWEKCGLFPLDLDVALAREGSVESGVWTNMGEETTPSEMEKVMFPWRAGTMYAPAVSLAMQEGEVSRREVEAPSGGEREHNQLLMRKFVVDMLTPQDCHRATEGSLSYETGEEDQHYCELGTVSQKRHSMHNRGMLLGPRCGVRS